MLKELFDEIQETIMIVGALVLWGGFEYLAFKHPNLQNETVTRTALITIVTNLFTFKFTKSQSPPRGGGN